ncbi:TIGR04283 family arsenosugar biosynthesis glycosyltransferase [Falsihalocynthiibacter sp. S25ZX9]|uniref:TIGR04283 family arsenosugar biosynthesis glycosyltransferase n=1 Tax=Falsihalocynthiibacter sp. S25ZX9 TaxID=3240870 RepID=UPI003510184E
MRAPLSIVIPTLNAGSELAPTLACLMEGLNAGLIRELVISDASSSDDTVEIAQLSGAEVVSGAVGRGAQLALGAAACSGEWLLFLHADSHLSEGWSAHVSRFIAQETDAGYGDLVLRDDAMMARMTARGANLRSRLFGLPYGDQTLLISRALYDEVGGYPDIPLMEDVALAKALKGRLKRGGFQSQTSAARYREQGYAKRSLRNLTTLLRYKLGADPKKLAQSYAKK